MSGPNVAPASRTISAPGGQERSPTPSVRSSTSTRWSLAWPCRSMTTFGSYRPRTTIRFAFHSRNFSCTDTRRCPCSWAMTSVHGTSLTCTKERRGSLVILFLLDVAPVSGTCWLIVTRREQRGPIALWHVVGVDVDLVRHLHTSRDLTQSSRVST